MDDGWERAKSYLGTGIQGPPSLHHPHPPIPPATPFLAVKWSSSPQGGLTYYYYYVLPLAKLLRTSSIQILLFFFFVSLSFFLFSIIVLWTCRNHTHDRYKKTSRTSAAVPVHTRSWAWLNKDCHLFVRLPPPKKTHTFSPSLLACAWSSLVATTWGGSHRNKF